MQIFLRDKIINRKYIFFTGLIIVIVALVGIGMIFNIKSVNKFNDFANEFKTYVANYKIDIRSFQMEKNQSEDLINEAEKLVEQTNNVYRNNRNNYYNKIDTLKTKMENVKNESANKNISYIDDILGDRININKYSISSYDKKLAQEQFEKIEEYKKEQDFLRAIDLSKKYVVFFDEAINSYLINEKTQKDTKNIKEKIVKIENLINLNDVSKIDNWNYVDENINDLQSAYNLILEIEDMEIYKENKIDKEILNKINIYKAQIPTTIDEINKRFFSKFLPIDQAKEHLMYVEQSSIKYLSDTKGEYKCEISSGPDRYLKNDFGIEDYLYKFICYRRSYNGVFHEWIKNETYYVNIRDASIYHLAYNELDLVKLDSNGKFEEQYKKNKN